MYVRVHDPRKPGDYLVLHQRDLDPDVHQPFDGPTPDAALTGDGTGAAAPALITDLNAEDAKAAIAEADAATLDAFEATEAAHPKYSGGRKAVIDAIAARRKALE